MENNNIWFYSLSTIAQSMASIAGLFAVFVIFKIDKINKNLFNIRGAIILCLSALKKNGTEFWNNSDKQLHQKAKEFLSSEDYQKTYGVLHDEYYGFFTLNQTVLDEFLNLEKNKNSINQKCFVNLIICIFIVCSSIVSLIFTDIITVYYQSLILPFLLTLSIIGLVITIFNIYNINIDSK